MTMNIDDELEGRRELGNGGFQPPDDEDPPPTLEKLAAAVKRLEDVQAGMASVLGRIDEEAETTRETLRAILDACKDLLTAVGGKKE